jgi:diguanylate cyclase (GGDEF)-like protein
MSTSRGGFAISLENLQGLTSLLCRGAFRGPAKISAKVWDADKLGSAQIVHDQRGTLLEAGIGILALTMLITALLNRSWLYWAFVGWLLLNMRMAALSAGTDFYFFGYLLGPDELITARKWTLCIYFSMTAALFTHLFAEELVRVRAGYPLMAAQLMAVVLPFFCIFAPFETILQVLWVATSIGAVILIYYLFRIMRHARTRVAWWYSASIVVTLISSFSEILAASFGTPSLSFGLNSVTSAIASALLVSAAVAEHLRADRLEKLEAQRILRTAYEDSPIGLFTINTQGEILKTNPVFRKMLHGNVSNEIKHISDIFDERVLRDIASLKGTKLRAIELQTRIQDTSKAAEKWYAIKASTTDGIMIEGTLQDITERYAANTRLEFLANHDSLTECFNLRGISRALGRLAHPPSAVAYFDLNHFKLINDLYGHAAGDIVLVQVAERMQTIVGTSGMLSRVGGDAFVIAFTGCTVSHATTLCESIVNAISGEPYRIGTQRFSLNVSAGLIGTERFGDSSLKEIISAADNLCRVAKKRPNQRLMVMQADDNFFRYHKDELQILSCLERGEVPAGLFLVMQPEISLTQPFDSLNFEILLRMRTSDNSIIPAGIIIEAAEMYGKTAIIDRWVVTTAIAWLEAHLGELKNTRFVSINLSGGSLNDEAFTEEIFTLFAQYPEILSLVCIEITESVALTDVSNVQRFIDRVRTLGAKVAIDDFGAGYSSFGYLRSLSVDALKLDGSLVKDATRNAAGLAIIQAIGSLVDNLGMKSIGEYAEDLPTIKALVNAGIDYAQGYGISKPVMPERILSAKSSADFIEDADILAFVLQLQTKENDTMSLFDNFQEDLKH